MKKTIQTIGQPILSGTFEEVKENVKMLFNGNGYVYKNSTCRTLQIFDTSKNCKIIEGYILKQENRIWNVYKTL